ncbi:MAG TPA: hypothetical protein VLU99_05300 [Nitrososphaerales archaeon]|nr:hypothetical protein [Nitrososphaerales archaeon]
MRHRTASSVTSRRSVVIVSATVKEVILTKRNPDLSRSEIAVCTFPMVSLSSTILSTINS